MFYCFLEQDHLVTLEWGVLVCGPDERSSARRFWSMSVITCARSVNTCLSCRPISTSSTRLSLRPAARTPTAATPSNSAVCPEARSLRPAGTTRRSRYRSRSVLVLFDRVHTALVGLIAQSSLSSQVQRLSVGSIPRSLVVVLEDDLVDSCKSGESLSRLLEGSNFRSDLQGSVLVELKRSLVLQL